MLNNWVIGSDAQVYVPMNGFAIEVSLANTGLDRLPMYQNSISSLIVQGDYIVGGTSAEEGLDPFIFVATLSGRKVISTQELNKTIAGQQCIKSGFCQGKNHVLYAGTMPGKGNIKNSRGGGHLIQVIIDQNGNPDIKDLGIPIDGEGVYSLLSDASGTMLYGISYPSGLFFTYDINNGRTRKYSNTAPSRSDIASLKLYILDPGDYLCEALIQADDGLIYGSMPVNKLFCFNPTDESFQILEDSIPAVWGRKMLGRIDSWAKSADGMLYGGNAGDGQLFLLDPATKKVKNLGKPVMMNRLRGLTFGKDGKLYGVGGAPPGYTHFFSYDAKNGFHDFGHPQFEMTAPGIEQGIGWKGYNIGTLVSSEDGKYIVMGEDEALSQLLIFNVPEKQAGTQTLTGEPDSLGPLSLRNIDTWSVHSNTIGEDYTLYVLRTAAYDTSDVRLPVLYMTDGDWNMTVAMNCFSMLRQDYNTREPLIVGIGYGKGKNQRFRDLDPQTGGPAFLTFIEKEVMPFIDKKYRTNKEKAIYGYSMGGMFTTYILFNRPDLFDMVFIGAPGNNGRQLMPAARQYFKDHKNLTGRVFIGVGSFEKETAKNIDSFTNYLLSYKCPGLKIRKDFTPGAGHGAALAQVMQNAVAFGYCERHEAIRVDPAILNQYAGSYVSEDKSLPDVMIFTDEDKLFWKWQRAGDLPAEMMPMSKTEYFMIENERILFTFRKVNNSYTLVVVPENNIEYHFTRNK